MTIEQLEAIALNTLKNREIINLLRKIQRESKLKFKFKELKNRNEPGWFEVVYELEKMIIDDKVNMPIYNPEYWKRKLKDDMIDYIRESNTLEYFDYNNSNFQSNYIALVVFDLKFDM